MSAWIKAGLVGGTVVALLNILSIIPCVGLIACLLGFLIYIGAGALAGYWMPPPRQPGTAAGQGALAGALAAIIGGIVNTIIATIQLTVTDTAAILSQMPQESLQQLEEMGMDPAIFTGPVAGLTAGSLCCLAGLIIAAILGAIGGAIFVAIRGEQ
jgi:hypothetical protein